MKPVAVRFPEKFSLLVLFFALAISLNAQKTSAPVKTRILFIFDESNSMLANWQNSKKIEVAKKLLIKMVDSLRHIDNVELALRMYGHQSPVPPQDCSDTKLEVPFASNNADDIIRKLKTTVPKGTTPIARSLQESALDFPLCTNCRNVIILITDGIEACDGDPCAVALALHNQGITLKPFIIGIGLNVQFKNAFDCIGQYYDANKEEEFETILTEVIKRALHGTTSQINLLNIHKEPKETDVNITLYNQKNGNILSNFVHTLNYKGNPDTLSLETDIPYKMVVHTIPPVTVENIEIQAGKHNTIEANTPQGSLHVIQDRGNNELRGTKIIVRQNKKSETLNVQDFFEHQKYIVGSYDLEILTLPRVYKSDIQISQSKTTSVKIEQPGVANIWLPSVGSGGIYVKQDGKINLVLTFDNQLKRNIQLQPGNYIAVYRPNGVKKTAASVTIPFQITSGRSVNVFFK